MMMRKIYMKAPAKINFGLWVTNKRDDGYHDIYTLFYPVHELFDELTFELNDIDEFISSDPNLPLDSSNLIIKAKNILEERAGKPLPLKIDFVKKIPYGAGLGGGSSDAAATLVCINELYKLNIPYNELLEIALQIGSDVPFFVKAKPSIGEQRGEKLTQVDFFIKENILIVNPGIHIGTGEAYSNIKPSSTEFNYTKILKENISSDVLKKLVKNDFEEYAFAKHPEIAAIKSEMYNHGAKFSLMSGSGSTVYGLFEDKDMAAKCSSALSASYLKLILAPNEF